MISFALITVEQLRGASEFVLRKGHILNSCARPCRTYDRSQPHTLWSDEEGFEKRLDLPNMIPPPSELCIPTGKG